MTNQCKKTVAKTGLILLMLIAGCVSCSGKSEDADHLESVPAVVPGAEPDTEQPKVLKLAMTMNRDSDMAWVADYFGKLVEDQTGDTVKIEVYTDSTLGDQNQFLQGMRQGTVEMCLVSLGTLEVLQPGFYDLWPAFTITDEMDATRAYESRAAKELMERLRSSTGLISLAEVYEGYRDIWSKEPVPDTTDLDGLRIRIPENNQAVVRIFTLLGAVPVPLPWNDVYSSLRAGVIDAVEIDMESVVKNRIYEVAPYCTQTRHLFSDGNIMIAEYAWEQLSKTEQEILSSCAKEASEAAKERYHGHQKKYRELLEQQGAVFREVPETERNKAKSRFISG